MTPSLMVARAEKFHEHLDECWQCREHPFDLCETGLKLLLAIQDEPKIPTTESQQKHQQYE